MLVIVSSSGKVVYEIHLFMQFVIGTVISSLSPPELMLQSIWLIYFNTWLIFILDKSNTVVIMKDTHSTCCFRVIGNVL